MMLVRLKRFRLRVPELLWRRVVEAETRRAGKRLEWFSPDHHLVRDFTVIEVARRGTPVTEGQIAAQTGVEGRRLSIVLDELERGKTFLYRSDGVVVDWAYPVTAARTMHRIRLDSGERFFAA